MKKSILLYRSLLLLIFSLPLLAEAQWHKEMDLTQTFVTSPVFDSQMRTYLSPIKNERLPSLVLIHGVGGSAKDFTEVIPLLKGRYNLIVFDLPGYGESKSSTTLYSASNYAINLSVVLPSLVSKTNYIVGHSMGGNIALQLSAMSPQLVDKLVLIDPAGILNKFSYSKYIALDKVDDVPFVSPKYQKKLSRFIDSVSDYVHDFTDILLSEPSRKYVLDNNSIFISAVSVMNEDLTLVLRDVNVDTLIIWGENDRVMPYQTGYMLDSVLANSTLELLPKLGHSPQREAPELVHNLINTFIDNTQASALEQSDAVNLAGSLVHDCNISSNNLDGKSYYEVIIINCENLNIDHLSTASLTIIDSKVSFSYLNIQNTVGFAIAAFDSNVALWGGNIVGEHIANINTSYVDLNGVNIVAEAAPFKTDGFSQVLASASMMNEKGTATPLHGFVVKQNN